MDNSGPATNNDSCLVLSFERAIDSLTSVGDNGEIQRTPVFLGFGYKNGCLSRLVEIDEIKKKFNRVIFWSFGNTDKSYRQFGRVLGNLNYTTDPHTQRKNPTRPVLGY